MTAYDYGKIASIVGEDKIDALREAGVQIGEKPVKPTTGLFGRWAKHKSSVDVLIVTDRPEVIDDDLRVRVFPGRENGESGSFWVLLSDLAFPEETTRPEDVPVGEAWLVNVDDEEASAEGVVALKRTKTYWNTEIVSGNAGSTGDWLNGEVTLIAPLAPVRPTEPETVTTEEEYMALPAGSIVAGKDDHPFTKHTGVWIGPAAGRSSSEMAGKTRRVLRWGWGE